MTQMGFVARVEHAPAATEADIRESHLFSAQCQQQASLIRGGHPPILA